MLDRTTVQRMSLLAIPVAGLAAIMLLPAVGWRWALCFGLSAAWASLNFYALTLVLDALVRQRSAGTAAALLPAKLAVLFGGLFLLTRIPGFEIAPFLIGFHVPFALIALDVTRRQVALQLTTQGAPR